MAKKATTPAKKAAIKNRQRQAQNLLNEVGKGAKRGRNKAAGTPRGYGSKRK